MSGGWVCPRGRPYVHGPGEWVSPSLDKGPGIQWDMVGKWAVYILLECFFVFDVTFPYKIRIF